MSTPADPILEQVRALEDDFADAMSRMYGVGNDLARLRARLVTEADPREWTPVDVPAPEPVAPEPVTTPEPAMSSPGHVTPPPAAPPATPFPPQEPWWQRDGLVAKVLAVVGTSITLIGVAFLLALAIQMGLFGPLARVLSGAALAVALVVAAVIVRRRPSGTIGALGLAATGIATGYLDVLAVTRIYEWVPLGVGMVLAGLIALGGVLLARSWDSQLLAVVAVLGVALMAPFVGLQHGLLTGGFLLVLAAATWPAQVGREWHVLELARIVPTALFLTALAAAHEQTGIPALLAVLLAFLVLGTSLAGARAARLPRQLGLLLAIASLPTMMAAVAVDDRWSGAGLFLALTCLLLLVAGLADDGQGTPLHLRLTEVALGTAGLTSVLAALRAGIDTGWTPALGLLVCLLWAVAALVLRHRATLVVALAVAAVGLLGATTLLPFVMARGVAGDVALPQLLAAGGLVALHLMLARAVTTTLPDLAPTLPRLHVTVSVLSAGGAVILLGCLLGQLLDDPQGGFTAGQAGATVLWMATAAVLLLRGLRGSTFAIPAGLALAALSVGKLLLFDLSFLGGIARVLSFIGAGLLLLAMGAGYAQALERTRRDSGTAPGPVENSPAGSPPPPSV